MSDFSPKRKVLIMSACSLTEARGLVEAIIGNIPPGRPLKAEFPRIARFVGLPERRLRAIWNKENRTISPDELTALRLALVSKSGTKAIHETLAHADRLDAAAHALASIDPEFHGAEIDRLRDMARRVRGVVDRGLIQ